MQILRNDIVQKDRALSTGIFGTKYLLEVLSAEGFADLAGQIVTRRDFPGWGFMLENGATTLWETWKPSANVYSQNHPMFGSVDEWLMKHVLGIAPAADAVGFDRIIIRPQAVAGLTWARGSYRSIKGPVRVDWRLVDGNMNLVIDIPPGTRARVWLPSGEKWVDVGPGHHKW